MSVLDQLVKHALDSNPDFVGMDDIVEKEILHHELLYVLHKEGFLAKLTFIGGTALRLCYESNRLSEDLDFAGGSQFERSDFVGLADHLQAHLRETLQTEVSVREPVLDKSDTSTWKITIDKYPNNKAKVSQKMHIDICSYPAIAPTHRPVVDHYSMSSKIAGTPLKVESRNEILADKMIAFAYRHRRIKPRDVWDIVWLHQQSSKLDMTMLKKKLALRNKQQKEFIALLNKLAMLINTDLNTREDFYQEMRRFVPPNVGERTLDNDAFWPYVGRIISEATWQIVSHFDGPEREDDIHLGMKM